MGTKNFRGATVNVDKTGIYIDTEVNGIPLDQWDELSTFIINEREKISSFEFEVNDDTNDTYIEVKSKDMKIVSFNTDDGDRFDMGINALAKINRMVQESISSMLQSESKLARTSRKPRPKSTKRS